MDFKKEMNKELVAALAGLHKKMDILKARVDRLCETTALTKGLVISRAATDEHKPSPLPNEKDETTE